MLPQDAVYSMLIDTDDERISKTIKLAASKKLLVNEDLRQVTE